MRITMARVWYSIFIKQGYIFLLSEFSTSERWMWSLHSRIQWPGYPDFQSNRQSMSCNRFFTCVHTSQFRIFFRLLVSRWCNIYSFLGCLRTLSLKFQKATSKIEVFLALPCWLIQFSCDSEMGRGRKTSILVRGQTFWKGYLPNLLETTLLHQISVCWVRDFKLRLLAYFLIFFNCTKFQQVWRILILDIL